MEILIITAIFMIILRCMCCISSTTQFDKQIEDEEQYTWIIQYNNKGKTL